jgi:GGDEF domain-containing protein
MSVSVYQESYGRPRRNAPKAEASQVRRATQLSRLLEVLSQEAIAVDETDANAHRARLKLLAQGVSPESVNPELESQLQVELHAYRESAEKKVHVLRKELASTADAMQEYVTRFSGQDEKQEKLLTADLERLAALRRVNSLAQVHAGLDAVRESLESTITQMKSQSQAIIAQLRDEIRTLHQRLESSDRRVERPGTLVNRAPFERRIRAKVSSHEVFSLYLIRVTNWKELINLFDQEEAQTVVSGISNRLSAILGPDTFTGRWYDGYFAAIIGVDKRAAMEGAAELAQQLTGIYPTGGRAPVALRVRVAVVDHIPGQDADQMLRRVEQLIRAFEG